MGVEARGRSGFCAQLFWFTRYYEWMSYLQSAAVQMHQSNPGVRVAQQPERVALAPTHTAPSLPFCVCRPTKKTRIPRVACEFKGVYLSTRPTPATPKTPRLPKKTTRLHTLLAFQSATTPSPPLFTHTHLPTALRTLCRRL